LFNTLKAEGRKTCAFDVLNRKKGVLEAIEYGINRRLFRSRQWGIIDRLAHHNGTDIDCCRARVGGEAEWDVGE